MATRANKRPNSNQSRAKGRPTKRIPVSGNRDILTVESKEPGFVYRWVNDKDNRIQRFLNAGYELVEHDVVVGERTSENSGKQSSVISKDVGKGITSFLMRIPREWYDEDQAAKQEAIDEQESDMKRQLNSGDNGTYGKVRVK